MFSKLKLNIIFAFMTILLCLSLLTTTTMALFTDSTGPIVARVNAGSMDVDLLQADENGDYASIKGEKGDVFGNQPWEPNHTRVVFLKIVNNSNIRIGYIFQLNVLVGDLVGALEVSVFNSEYYDTSTETWESISQKSAPVLLENGGNTVSGNDYVMMEVGEVHYYAVAVHMLPESGNVYQNKKCVIDVTVFATQGNAA